MFLTNFAKSKLTKFLFIFMFVFGLSPLAISTAEAKDIANQSTGADDIMQKIVDAFKTVRTVVFIVGAFVLMKFALDTIIKGDDFQWGRFAMIAVGLLIVGGVGFLLEAMVGEKVEADSAFGRKLSEFN